MDRLAERMWTVYGLYDPRSGALRYVGQTGLTLKKRMHNHYKARLKDTTPVARWVKELADVGLRAAIKPLSQWPTREAALSAERRAIWDASAPGVASLLNGQGRHSGCRCEFCRPSAAAPAVA